MNISIQDKRALATIRPLEVATYLRSQGWEQYSNHRNASVWSKNDTNGDPVDVLLPLDPSVGDYALRMGEILKALSSIENRSQYEIFADLLTTFADVIRARIDDAELRDGSIPIELHSQIAQRARDLILAAACSATQKRAVWHSNKPRQAIDQMRRVRIGQSERGSYVFSIVSPVSPELHTPANGILIETQEPFERQMTQMLATSLVALDNAAAQAASTGEFEAFNNAIEHGVSANLCEAIAGFWGDDDRDRKVEFSFSWSPARHIDPSIPRRIQFQSDRIMVIREAARVMKEFSPSEDFELEGAVVKLERENPDRPGRVTVIGLIDDKQRRVTLDLNDQQYTTAIKAHEQQLPFRCVGTLKREGRGHTLLDPRDVSVQEE